MDIRNLTGELCYSFTANPSHLGCPGTWQLAAVTMSAMGQIRATDMFLKVLF